MYCVGDLPCITEVQQKCKCQVPCVRGAPDVRSPVAVVIYTDTHTYKQKVLLYSKFMFNSKATANGNRYVREHLNSWHPQTEGGRGSGALLIETNRIIMTHHSIFVRAAALFFGKEILIIV